MAKPFDATGKHLIEARPHGWLGLAGFPVPESADDISIVVSPTPAGETKTRPHR